MLQSQSLPLAQVRVQLPSHFRATTTCVDQIASLQRPLSYLVTFPLPFYPTLIDHTSPPPPPKKKRNLSKIYTVVWQFGTVNWPVLKRGDLAARLGRGLGLGAVQALEDLHLGAALLQQRLREPGHGGGSEMEFLNGILRSFCLVFYPHFSVIKKCYT
jgi:hypothetical protein